MQPDPGAGLLLSLLFLLMGLKLLVGRAGVFRGFSEGFWNGFFNWLFVGSRRPSGTANPLGCLVRLVLSLLLLGFLGLALLLVMGLAGSIPVK